MFFLTYNIKHKKLEIMKELKRLVIEFGAAMPEKLQLKMTQQLMKDAVKESKKRDSIDPIIATSQFVLGVFLAKKERVDKLFNQIDEMEEYMQTMQEMKNEINKN